MEADLDLVSGQRPGETSVAHAALLVRFAEAAILGSEQEMREAREDLVWTLGPRAAVDAAAVVAIFCCNVRVADASGVPLDEATATVREQIGERVGIARYREVDVSGEDER